MVYSSGGGSSESYGSRTAKAAGVGVGAAAAYGGLTRKKKPPQKKTSPNKKKPPTSKSSHSDAVRRRIEHNNRPATARAEVQGKHAMPKKPSGRPAITSGNKPVPRASSSKAVAVRNGAGDLVRTGPVSKGSGGAKVLSKWGKRSGIGLAAAAVADYGMRKQEEKNKKGYYLTSAGIGASGYGTPKYQKRGAAATTKRPIGNADGSTTAGTGKKSRSYEDRLHRIAGKSNMQFGSSVAEKREKVHQQSTPSGKGGKKFYLPPSQVSKNGLESARRRRETKGQSSVYTAAGGDSWGRIAKETGVPLSELRAANPWMKKHHGNVIYRNSKIRIPGNKSSVDYKARRAALRGQGNQSGDTIGKYDKSKDTYSKWRNR